MFQNEVNTWKDVSLVSLAHEIGKEFGPALMACKGDTFVFEAKRAIELEARKMVSDAYFGACSRRIGRGTWTSAEIDTMKTARVSEENRLEEIFARHGAPFNWQWEGGYEKRHAGGGVN